MNTLRKTLAEKYGLVADIMHDDYFFVQLPDNEDHSLKFLESNLPECIRVALAECFAGSVIAAWEVPLFLLPQVLQQAHDFVVEYWEQVSQQWWTEALSSLRDRITALTGYKFRIVIGNQYRSGQDSISWHADNEPSMGFNPAIASISLGSCRKFQIKPFGGRPTDFWLEHGSLLVMHPGCQSTHLHQVPKTNKVVSTRINLTFRPHTGGGK